MSLRRPKFERIRLAGAPSSPAAVPEGLVLRTQYDRCLDTLLAARLFADVLRSERDEARGQVVRLSRRLEEWSAADARLMQDYNTTCALAKQLRDDLKELVRAALGSWDDDGDSVEQVSRALERIREANRFTLDGPEQGDNR